MYLSF